MRGPHFFSLEHSSTVLASGVISGEPSDKPAPTAGMLGLGLHVNLVNEIVPSEQALGEHCKGQITALDTSHLSLQE